MSGRPNNLAQADLFCDQGDLFAWASEAERALWKKASPSLLPERPLAALTPMSLLGEAMQNVGQRYDDPEMEAAGLRLQGRKPH